MDDLQRNCTPVPADISPRRLGDVQAQLLRWFERQARDLPWRSTRDPYKILVSEVMLQQTQVDRVVPYYYAFLEQFPNVEELAQASTAAVIKAWAGLGYNRRAVNLQRAAQAVVEQHGGRFPEDVAELVTLPGIGPYTAGAIACFAFERDVAFIDTNIRRVLYRLFIGGEHPAPTGAEKTVMQIARSLILPGDGWRWNQALIEFGALQCTARRPACVICPLQSDCAAFPTIQSSISTASRKRSDRSELPFQESNRFYRGKVVAALRNLPSADEVSGIDLAALGSQVKPAFSEADLPWLYQLVQGLAQDGLAQVAEERPGYDLGDSPETAAGLVRVKLP